MNAAWPRVAARLLTVAPALPGWAGVVVYDGPPVTGDAPTDYLAVGYVEGEDFGGTYEQTRGFGDLPEEVGSVRCELVCWTGDATDMAGRRARVFALVDALEAELARDPTLGVLGAGSTASLAVDVQPVQNTAGAAVRLTVTVNYTARP